MAGRQMQRQRAGDGRLPYTAFSHDKSQLSHREIVCGEPFLPQIHADERRLSWSISKNNGRVRKTRLLVWGWLRLRQSARSAANLSAIQTKFRHQRQMVGRQQ